jgi:hypothetical protein
MNPTNPCSYTICGQQELFVFLDKFFYSIEKMLSKFVVHVQVLLFVFLLQFCIPHFDLSSLKFYIIHLSSITG